MFILLSGLLSGIVEFTCLMLPVAIFVYLLEACFEMWKYVVFKIIVIALVASLVIVKTKIKDVLPFAATLANLYLSIYRFFWSAIKTFFLFIYKVIKETKRFIKKRIGYLEPGDEGWYESIR